MGFLFKNKGTIISDYFKLCNDINETSKAGNGNMVDVSLYEDHLSIMNAFCRSTVTLSYNKITDVQYTCELETIKSNKSPIGRALVGGILFGGVGSLVGAVSANGQKTKKKLAFYFIISYISNDSEEKFIVMEDTRLYRGRKLSQKLKELCNISDSIGIKEEEL